MSIAPARTLPITAPPVPYETLGSYLDRLDRLNHLKRDALLSVLATGPITRWKLRELPPHRIDIKRLSAMTGYPIPTLQRAMPQLRSPRPDNSLLQPDVRPPCPRCTKREGGQIWCRFPLHRYLCLKHKIWLGCRTHAWTYQQDGPMLDVSGLPELIQAQHRHRKLTRRHGEQAMAQALRRAEWCLDHWSARSFVTGAQADRLNVLLNPGWKSISQHSPAYVASYYPEMVTLAGVLASPRWRAIAANPTTRPRFFAEIARQRDWPEHLLPYPEPTSGPLHDWIVHLEQATRSSTRIRFAEPAAFAADQRI